MLLFYKNLKNLTTINKNIKISLQQNFHIQLNETPKFILFAFRIIFIGLFQIFSLTLIHKLVIIKINSLIVLLQF